MSIPSDDVETWNGKISIIPEFSFFQCYYACFKYIDRIQYLVFLLPHYLHIPLQYINILSCHFNFLCLIVYLLRLLLGSEWDLFLGFFHFSLKLFLDRDLDRRFCLSFDVSLSFSLDVSNTSFIYLLYFTSKSRVAFTCPFQLLGHFYVLCNINRRGI